MQSVASVVAGDDAFVLVEKALAAGGAAAALDLLARKFLAEKQYPQLFETRLMQKRQALGLSLIQLGAIEDLPEPSRSSYEDGVRQAAREIGGLYLAEGDIPARLALFSCYRGPGDSGFSDRASGTRRTDRRID